MQNQPTVGNYISTQILGMIPLIGFILMIVWAVGGGDTPVWKRNFARAYFAMAAIGVVLVIIGVTAFGGVLAALLSGF